MAALATPPSTSFTRLRSADVGTGTSTPARPVLRHVEGVHDLAAGHGVHLAVAGAQFGDAERDICHSADRCAACRDAELDKISEAVLLLGDEEEPAEQVLHDALRAEAERGTQ